LQECKLTAGSRCSEENQQATHALRMAETTGRPVGHREWIEEIERRSGRSLAPRKRGPKARAKSAEGEGILCI
jgi:hypothetical protein